MTQPIRDRKLALSFGLNRKRGRSFAITFAVSLDGRLNYIHANALPFILCGCVTSILLCGVR
jgi:hypothetical protein